VWIDDDGAGLGWSVVRGPSSVGYDLLTVVKHELGHVIGMDHDDHGLMAPVLAATGQSSVVGWQLALGDELAFRQAEPDLQESQAESELARSASVDRVLSDSLLDDLRVVDDADDDEDEVVERLVGQTQHDGAVDELFAQFAAE